MARIIRLDRAWTLGDVIGAGGFGQVYAATADDGIEGALKFVRKAPGADRELLFVDLPNVRNVIPIVENGEDDENWILAMPRAEMSLRQRLRDAGSALEPDDALPILVDVANALADLQGRICHRDLKPENVLLLEDHWCVSDFGIARYADATTARDTWKDVWSAPYNPPERWRGDRATGASDIYSFGVMAYEILVGRRPFEDPDLRTKHLSQVPPATGLPAALDCMIVECLEKAREARPTAAIVASRLQRVARPVSDALALLQKANQAVVLEQSHAATMASAAQQEAERRGELHKAAERSLITISEALRDRIAENAGKTEVIGPGTDILESLELGKANLLIGKPVIVSNREWATPSPPFDVICFSTIRLRQQQGPNGYQGRSHSLWFCDGEVEGAYRWFELAFVDAIHGLDGPVERPNSLAPATLSANGLRPIMAGVARLAYGPMPIDQGDQDPFIDAWIDRFARASMGQLEPPSQPFQGDFAKFRGGVAPGEPTPPESMFWLPLLHPCGDVVDWGVESNESEQVRLVEFLRTAAALPCPWHGSATGVPSTLPRDRTYLLVANRIWYRLAESDQAKAGALNRETAMSHSDEPALDVATVDAAPALAVPKVRKKKQSGLVLEVRWAAIRHPDAPQKEFAYIETTGGSVFRLPDALFAWAFEIGAVVGPGGIGGVQTFPAQVEFGILRGRMYAEIL
jgi:serine/threonine-protein kinase